MRYEEGGVMKYFEEYTADEHTNYTFKTLLRKGIRNARIADPDDLIYDIDLVVRCVKDFVPRSHYELSIFVSVVKSFVTYASEHGAVDTCLDKLEALDRKKLWDEMKDGISSYLLGEDEYKNIIADIEQYQGNNALYYTTLMMAVYEGLFASGITVPMYLRRGDINGNEVTLRQDEDSDVTWTVKVSDKLARNLVKLSYEIVWERYNRVGGIIEQTMVGLHDDSCFKCVRNKNGTSYERSYSLFAYRKIQYIVKEYIGRKMSYKNIAMSGVLHRSLERARALNIDVKKAVEKSTVENESSVYTQIMMDEGSKINYNITPRYVREYTRSYFRF